MLVPFPDKVEIKQAQIVNEMENIMEKGKFNFINFGSALGRSEMKKLMAGSGSTNWVVCTYDSHVCDACATYDGSSPYYKCSQVCGDWPNNASWGSSSGCSAAGW